MKLSTVLFLVIFGVIVVFAAANWQAIMAPTTISFIFTSVQAPLGLILICLLLVVSGFFLAFLVYLQTSVLLDARRHARELQAQRQLADQAEASRFTDLRAFLDGELKGVLARIDGSEQALKQSIEHAGNSLSAYIGELEDRLERR